jgi:hypothetical protein
MSNMALTRVASRSKQGDEVIRLLSEMDAYMKESLAILKRDHVVIKEMAEDIRKIKFNTQ